ncbi:neuroglian-like [Cylas formicarius]|uniref:neuroglian-like n=1 Tax=Cylas formicarius TaxID=197179 RepID=UPI002958D242|nr:neuroglian-like [Cylas formicarius]
MTPYLRFFGIILKLTLLFRTYRGEHSDNGENNIRELIPLQAPENLTLLNFDDRDAIIKWEPVSPDSVRGTFRGYIVRVWNGGLSQVYAIPPEIQKTAVQFFPYSKNFITVAVRNDKYVGPRSAAISFDAPQTEPGLPYLFEQNQLGSSSVLLQWSKPTHPNGILLGYNLYCSEAVEYGLDTKTTVTEFIQGADNVQAKLTGLKEGLKYQIEIAAVNCAGEGERNSLIVEIEEHVPYPPSMPSFKYKINYPKARSFDEYFDNECSKPRYPYVPQTNVDFDDSDDDFYLFNNTAGKIITPKPTRPPEDMQVVTAEDPCLVKTLIKWIPDVDHNPGEHFYVKYRIKGDKKYTDTPPETSEDYMILDNFNACKSHEIILVAVDGEYHTESEVQETPAVLFMHRQ